MVAKEMRSTPEASSP